MTDQNEVFRTYYYMIFQKNGTQIKAKEFVLNGKPSFMSRFNAAAPTDMIYIPNEYRDIIIAKSDITTVIQGVEIGNSTEITFPEWLAIYEANPSKMGFDHYRMPYLRPTAKCSRRKPFVFTDAESQILYKQWLDANKDKTR